MISPPCQQSPRPPPTNTRILASEDTSCAVDASILVSSARRMLCHRDVCSPLTVLVGPGWFRQEPPGAVIVAASAAARPAVITTTIPWREADRVMAAKIVPTPCRANVGGLCYLVGTS